MGHDKHAIFNCLRQTFVDWCTQHVAVALLQKKSQAFQELKRLIMTHENLLHRKLKYLFTDRGGEYISEELKDWFAEKGIVHDFSVSEAMTGKVPDVSNYCTFGC